MQGRRCDKIGAEHTSHWDILFGVSRDSSSALRGYPSYCLVVEPHFLSVEALALDKASASQSSHRLSCFSVQHRLATIPCRLSIPASLNEDAQIRRSNRASVPLPQFQRILPTPYTTIERTPDGRAYHDGSQLHVQTVQHAATERISIIEWRVSNIV